jgi:hypothetical protein
LFALFNADKLANWGKNALGLDWKSNTIDRKKRNWLKFKQCPFLKNYTI